VKELLPTELSTGLADRPVTPNARSGADIREPIRRTEGSERDGPKPTGTEANPTPSCTAGSMSFAIVRNARRLSLGAGPVVSDVWHGVTARPVRRWRSGSSAVRVTSASGLTCPRTCGVMTPPAPVTVRGPPARNVWLRHGRREGGRPRVRPRRRSCGDEPALEWGGGGLGACSPVWCRSSDTSTRCLSCSEHVDNSSTELNPHCSARSTW
jgi:hypothetical protein